MGSAGSGQAGEAARHRRDGRHRLGGRGGRACKRPRGHRLRPLARQAGRAARRVRVVQGDLADASVLAAAVPGHDAVISAVGASPDREQLDMPPRACATSSAPCGRRASAAWWAWRAGPSTFRESGSRSAAGSRPHFVRLMARNVVEAKQREFDVVRATDLDWTMFARRRRLRAADRADRDRRSAPWIPRHQWRRGCRHGRARGWNGVGPPGTVRLGSALIRGRERWRSLRRYSHPRRVRRACGSGRHRLRNGLGCAAASPGVPDISQRRTHGGTDPPGRRPGRSSCPRRSGRGTPSPARRSGAG